MSYDISLNDPITGDTVLLPFKHVMTGGKYAADYDEITGIFTPKPIAEATMNITYNYSRYYHEAYERGIREIYGKTGLESIEILEKMIGTIKRNHPNLETSENYWDICPGNAIKPLYQLLVMAKLRPDGMWDGD